MLTIHQRVLATLAYADVFDYPLTREEIVYWCIGSAPAKLSLPTGTRRIGNFVFLGKHKNHIEERRFRFVWSGQKREMARRISLLIRFVPTVELVGVTGGVAINNANYRDDVDLFVICRKGTLWSTRLLVTLIVDLMGRRRRPGDRRVQNKLCLNMFMSDDALSLPLSERDLFAAHEVLQMVPLYQRGRTYQKFLIANMWARKLLPNAWKDKMKHLPVHAEAASSNVKPSLDFWIFLARITEFPARIGQRIYMRRRRTSEVVTDTVLRFHPRDARGWIKRKFAARLRRFGIPLDKVFYPS